MVNDFSLPIDVVFNKIDFFVDINFFTEKDNSDRRKLALVYIIFN